MHVGMTWSVEYQAPRTAYCTWDCSHPSRAILCLCRRAPAPFSSVALNSLGDAPLPVADFRQILAVVINVMFVLDKFVLHHLLEIGALGAQIRDAINHVLNEMKAIEIVLH